VHKGLRVLLARREQPDRLEPRVARAIRVPRARQGRRERLALPVRRVWPAMPAQREPRVHRELLVRKEYRELRASPVPRERRVRRVRPVQRDAPVLRVRRVSRV
jgi:hypothetical protein